MRVGYTGFEGHPLIETPNLDHLASVSAHFVNSFATSPICTPSRTSLLTGQYERRHGINFNSGSFMSEEDYQKTYPMVLRDAGYFVGYIGKNHTPIGENDNGQSGYQSGIMDRSFDYWYASHGHLKFYPKDIPRHAIFQNATAETQVEILAEGVSHFFSPIETFNAGREFLETRPVDQPFALLINLNVPHNGGTGSMQMRESDDALYRSGYRDRWDQIEMPASYVPWDEIETPKLPVDVYNGEYIDSYNYVKTVEDMREREVRTLQTITGIDRMIGELLTTLEAHDILDETLIIFTSDHGLLHGEHGLGGKALLYEPSIRIPLIVFDPKMARNSEHDELVALVDIGPTILDMAGLDIPIEMQGKSLKPLIRRTQVDWRDTLFLENMMTLQNYPRIEAVRTQHWKYLRYFDRGMDQRYAGMLVASVAGEAPIYEELYNLVEDPHELSNLANDPVHTETLNELRTRTGDMVKSLLGEDLMNSPKVP